MEITAALVVLSALALPQSVGSKGRPLTVKLCGSKECVVSKRPLFQDLLRGRAEARVAPLASFYSVRFLSVEGELPVIGYFVQSANLFWRPLGYFGSPGWVRPTRAELAALRALISRAAPPFPVPRVVVAWVRGTRVSSPAVYARLYDDFPSVARPPAGRRVEIALRWSRSNPWQSTGVIEYFPAERVLFRDYAWYRLPPTLGAQIERDAGLRR